MKILNDIDVLFLGIYQIDGNENSLGRYDDIIINEINLIILKPTDKNDCCFFLYKEIKIN